MQRKPPRQFQSVYPEPQEKFGMAARKPTVFSVPILKLSLMLFIPVALAMLLPSLYIDYGFAMRYGPAVNTIVLSAGIFVATVLSVVLLAYAHSIVTRNCSHPFVIQALYLLVIVPVSVLLISHFPLSLENVSPRYYISVQAGLIYIMSLGLSLLSRALSL